MQFSNLTVAASSSSKTPPKRQATELIYNQNRISALLRRLLQNAKGRVDICLDTAKPSSSIMWTEGISKELLAAKERGVDVRFIADITNDSSPRYEALISFIEIRHLGNVRGDYIIIDGARYISVTTTTTHHTDRPVVQAIYSTAREIVEQQQYLFDTIWAKAEPLIKEIESLKNDEASHIEITGNTRQGQKLYLELLDSSTEEILMVVPTSEAFRRQKAIGLLDSLRAASRRKVKIRLLTPLSKSAEDELKDLLEDNSLIVKSIEISTGPKMTFLIADKQSLLAVELNDNSKKSFMEAAGKSLYSTSKPTVYSYITMFENFWKSAELNERFKAADRLKDEFINIAAHELRTPLMPILGAMEMLMLRLSNTNDEEIKENTSIIVRNVNRLQKLAEEILQVSRIETGNFTLFVEEIDLNALVSKIIDDVVKKYDTGHAIANNRPRGEDSADRGNLYSLIVNVIGDIDAQEVKRSQIIFDPQPKAGMEDSRLLVRCDQSKISQVLFNILDNAMKFSSNKGKVIVRTRAFDSNVVVTVRDSGKGIDPLIRDRLFEKFVSKSENGTGLGLYVSRKIVEIHGGKIWAHNNVGDKGATFMFSLPFSAFSAVKYDNEPKWLLPAPKETYTNLDVMRKEALQKIEIIKENLVAAREEAVRLRNEKIEEFQAKVEQSRKLLTARQEILNQQINYNKMRQKVDRRIEQGLEGLQRLIEGLKENILGEDTLEKLTMHPILSNAIILEARKVQETEFFKSIKNQLEKEEDKEEKEET